MKMFWDQKGWALEKLAFSDLIRQFANSMPKFEIWILRNICFYFLLTEKLFSDQKEILSLSCLSVLSV